MFGPGKLEMGKLFFDCCFDWGLHFCCGLGRRCGSALRWCDSLRGSATFGIPTFMGVDLRLAQAGEVLGNGVFGVQAEMFGVGANKSFVEDSARELVEAFFLDSPQHARTDLGDVGNVIEGEFFILACFAKLISEIAHGRLREHDRTSVTPALRDGRSRAG